MEIREMLGQKLVFGFHGTQLTEEFKALIRRYKIGNVILFLRNVESASQLRQLCSDIQTLIREETGGLIRNRVDLEIRMRIRETLVRENRRFAVNQAPAVILRT